MSNVILITGVAGFIGRYVARYFAAQGWSVVGTDSAPPENSPLANLVEYQRFYLPDAGFNQLIKKYSPQAFIHCAGRASVGLSVTDPSADFYSNTALTLEALNSLRLYAPECRFIFLSSAAVYGNPENLPVDEKQKTIPLSPYGFHKLQGEQLCLEFFKVYGLPTASARIFSAYGPGLRRQVMWDICHKAMIEQSVTLQGTGKESRDFIHAIDIAKALQLIATSSPMQGEAYNLATGREVSISELSTLLLDTLEYNGGFQFDGVVPVGNPLNWKADISKLSNIGFSPSVPIEKGVQIFANWCRAELVGV
ncbi:MAG: dTDP-glucose 4,6-dehydratase [Leptolyngbya foveolarum]|uniref:dTDP-glucose 4,6-dehydratase n=1 Tax=Leptolyngbya foveolarum TaxID=47253 RepID=A0A2W4UDA3_9CYAN|nr:MAG: dTDP-glucose 4,6-dehydratase [Leptolyngbya foveolarum]